MDYYSDDPPAKYSRGILLQHAELIRTSMDDSNGRPETVGARSFVLARTSPVKHAGREQTKFIYKEDPMAVKDIFSSLHVP